MPPLEDPSRTTTALLEGLFDAQNHAMWGAFDQRFHPVIVAAAQRMGMRWEDANDIAQETILQFVQAYRAGKYDRSKGKLGSWVLGIARNRCIDLMRKRDELRGARGESALDVVPDGDELTAIWEAECRQKILVDAFQALSRGTEFDAITIEAFRLYGVEQKPAKAVAAELGIGISSVYMAKHRCAGRLRELQGQLLAAYELG